MGNASTLAQCNGAPAALRNSTVASGKMRGVRFSYLMVLEDIAERGSVIPDDLVELLRRVIEPY
jgi:hypothetical protein